MKLNINRLVFFFLLFTSINGFSQAEEDYRLIVGVAKFTSLDVRQEHFAAMLSERVLDVLNQQNRFLVIDLDGTARNEVINKAQENYKSKNWIESNKSINAEYTLAGVLTSVKFIRLNAGKGYKATITYTLKIMNTESGEIIQNGTVTLTSSESDIKLTPETALESAIQTTIPELSNYITSSFPIKLNLVRIEKEKNEKALSVLLDGGSKVGVQENLVFECYYIDNSLGKPLPRIVGKIKISKILSEDFSEAKVTTDGKEIYTNFKEEKKIICKNIQQ
ncbi:MAG: hypothetical protein GW772_09790 [Flavobacteriia bacterium]|nr:hypothetical protein [Flavobacteriia bacterium]OIP46513.1 MAG: hypothetical protein AUK46_08200 [Flavobacteriaceae bacterium CG2_30_31_66]PIV96456.1 MAG: hypothetical protein COW43_08045 [Flavobacteriaceae bacterium CG17_big_fil_post_rev_8_21_14_2_50_31_13]PIX14550.1 MAG: hypothetical protein COZ74_02640 [Flavobacteriaceae bacterium CG_4_8_14_3_um_filter_31_8]PIY15077.1 MAG: hypothetical protein COZ16_05700 [Flavobacteriaceae bacterium CG_4_10_14_3_um_filter_31_253]PIZ09717.1 MAG: hypotheti